jgi:predicted secreted protein
MEFGDCRAGKVVLVPHCALNQNARLAKCAESPVAVVPLIAGLLDREIGVAQMPCPERELLGLDREHVNIRSALESRPAREALRRMAAALAGQVEDYRACGVAVLGVLGKNGSPACGVEQTWYFERGPGMGVFIELLREELALRKLDLPMTGMMDAEPDKALAAVDAWAAEQEAA